MATRKVAKKAPVKKATAKKTATKKATPSRGGAVKKTTATKKAVATKKSTPAKKVAKKAPAAKKRYTRPKGISKPVVGKWAFVVNAWAQGKDDLLPLKDARALAVFDDEAEAVRALYYTYGPEGMANPWPTRAVKGYAIVAPIKDNGGKAVVDTGNIVASVLTNDAASPRFVEMYFMGKRMKYTDTESSVAKQPAVTVRRASDAKKK